MKQTRIFILLFFYLSQCYSQSLQGNWDGYFISTNSRDTSVYLIKLKFESTKKKHKYRVYTFTTFHDLYKNKALTIKCKATCKFYAKDSLFLRVTKMLSNPYPNYSCLQTMYLKISESNGIPLLDGVWKSDAPCNFIGIISFKREEQ